MGLQIATSKSPRNWPDEMFQIMMITRRLFWIGNRFLEIQFNIFDNMIQPTFECTVR